MLDTEQELEAKRQLHDMPITETEAEKVLELLEKNGNPIIEDKAKQEVAEAELNIRALSAQKEQGMHEQYNSDLDRITDALKYYQAELGRLWDNQDFGIYEATSNEMRDFRDTVESTLKSVPDSIRNLPLENEIKGQFTRLLEEDEDHLQSFHGAQEAQNIQRTRRSESETLAPSPEKSKEIRKKVENKIVLDSEFEALKKAFERLAEKGTPTDEQIKMLHEGMEDIRTRLGQDEDAKDLQEKLLALENKYPIHIPVDLTGVRALARQVKAQYISVQHQLAPDQRRAFRGRIARLSGMVRQIEDRRWHDLVGHLIKNPKSSYIKGDKHINASLVMAMTRAKRTAPLLADLALAKAIQDLSTE